MKTSKKELLRALEAVAIGLACKELIEQSTSYVFLEDRVLTYNDEVSVSFPYAAGFTGVVPAKELLALVRRCSAEDIDVEVTESELLMKAGSIEAGLTLKQEITLPTETIEGAKKWRPVPPDFAKALKFCMGSCATDMSRFILTNVHVRGTDVIEASDGLRISQYMLEKEMGCDAFLIPAHVCSKIHGYDLKKICVDGGWVHFMTADKAIISCRIVSEAYPDTDAHTKIKGSKITFPKELKEALERAAVFYKKDYVLDELVDVAIAKGRMTLKANGVAGWSEEKLRVTTDAEVSFCITPYLLQDILSETLDAELQTPKLIFKGTNWLYLTLLRG